MFSGETAFGSAVGEDAKNSQAKAPKTDEPLERALPAEEAIPLSRRGENLSGQRTEMQCGNFAARLCVLFSTFDLKG
jgi:hypothetical protein